MPGKCHSVYVKARSHSATSGNSGAEVAGEWVAGAAGRGAGVVSGGAVLSVGTGGETTVAVG